MTRGIAHRKVFMMALDSLGEDSLSVGRIPPASGLVDRFFNDSTGEEDHGEAAARGPWNEGNGWQFVESPAFRELRDKSGAR
jgi:Mn-containing catalase